MRAFILAFILLGVNNLWANTILHEEDFDNCGSITWTAVAGSGNSDSFGWECTTWSGRTFMDIYDSNGTGDEDWLISPSFDLDAYSKEYFSFEYNNNTDIAGLTLMYSTDYSGAGNAAAIAAATWTALPTDPFDIDNGVSVSQFLFQRSVDLSAISGTSVYLAFRYISPGNGTQGWSIDNVRLTADYYAPIEAAIASGSKCLALKVVLHNHIKDHRRFNYTSSDFDIWDALYVTDRRLNDAGSAPIVYDMYSDNPTGPEDYEFTFGVPHQDVGNGTSSTPEGTYYNREHVFPKSWWGGGTTSTDTQHTDIHYVIPSDYRVNYLKWNYPLGEVDSPTDITNNGTRLGPNSTAGYSGTVLEPIDEYKGDFARLMFYVSTRYMGYAPS
jgi:hypothetical protein